MFEPFERDVDRDVEESMSLFRRAQIGDVAGIEPRRAGHVLLVLDGSAQDDLSIRFAQHLHEHMGARLSVVDARETAEGNSLAAEQGSMLAATVLDRQTGESFDQILAGIDRSQCDLVILPCPYGRNLESVGPDSVGTVIDVLLSRSPVPLLVVREPYQPDGNLFDSIVIGLIGENEAAHRAAEWAVGLRQAVGQLQLVLMLETEFYENVRDLLATVAPEQRFDARTLGEALVKANVRLHRALQKSAEAHGFDYALSLRQQDESGPDPLAGAGRHPLIVLPLERGDYASEGYVHDRIRRSSHVLLVIPSARPEQE